MNNRKNRNRQALEKPPELTEQQRIILELADMLLSFRQNGEVKHTSAREAMIMRHQQKALEGSPHALNQMHRRLQEAEEAQAKRRAYHEDLGRRWLAHQRQELADLEAKYRRVGMSAAEIRRRTNDMIFHPDDYELREDGPTFNGPYDEASLARLHKVLKIRDSFLMQHELDRTEPLEMPVYRDEEATLSNEMDTEICCGRSAILLAMFFEELVPERFRRSDLELDLHMRDYRIQTTRELKKNCYRTWKELGFNLPRGWLTPPHDTMKRMLELQVRIFNDVTTLGKQKERENATVTLDECTRIVRDVYGEFGIVCEA